MKFNEIAHSLTENWKNRKQKETVTLEKEDSHVFVVPVDEKLYALELPIADVPREGDLYTDTPDMSGYLQFHFYNGKLSQVQRPRKIAYEDIPEAAKDNLIVVRFLNESEKLEYEEKQQRRRKILREPRRDYTVNEDDDYPL